MDAGNSVGRADSGSAGAAGKPEESQALTEEALHIKRIQVRLHKLHQDSIFGQDAAQGGNLPSCTLTDSLCLLQATQEKNRRNQRKYRERQKVGNLLLSQSFLRVHALAGIAEGLHAWIRTTCMLLFSTECDVQAKITSSEQQIKDLADKAEALERTNENLVARVRELELAAHVAAQNAAAAGVRLPDPQAALPESGLQSPSHWSRLLCICKMPVHRAASLVRVCQAVKAA